MLSERQDLQAAKPEQLRESALTSEVRRLLDGPNLAHIATLPPDGSPHSVPLWVGLEGELIAILTSPGSRKARNLSRDPRVAISVTDRERPTAMGSIRGRVIRLVDGEKA
jgi:PPOX class probable F420-dependent enzyme